ncbi:hypothetical protein COCNU_scaffold095456G000010 [Cocos nucifera]|nr:hypothetical protein [Cocos nucifera]
MVCSPPLLSWLDRTEEKNEWRRSVGDYRSLLRFTTVGEIQSPKLQQREEEEEGQQRKP